MRFGDSLGYAFKAISKRKTRTALTILGIVVGIGAVTALVSVSTGLRTALTSEFQKTFATSQIFVFGDENYNLFPKDNATLLEVEHVTDALPVVFQEAVVTYSNGSQDTVELVGVDITKYADYYPKALVVDSGEIPPALGPNDLVIGRSVFKPRKYDGLNLTSMGGSLNLSLWAKNGEEFVEQNTTGTVKVILKPIGGFGGGGIPSDRMIVMDFHRVQALLNISTVTMFLLKMDTDNAKIIENVTKAIETKYDDKVFAIAPTSVLEETNAMMNSMESFLAGIAGISLLVAGIGIMNIQIVSMMERRREIGLLKALGMRRRGIMGVFLNEAFIIGLLGSIIGLIAGYTLAGTFASTMSGGIVSVETSEGDVSSMFVRPAFTAMLVIQGLGFGLLVSMVFGLYPAWRAANQHPVTALRYE